MIPTIVVERRLKEEISSTIPGDTETLQMTVMTSESTDEESTPLPHLQLTERKSTAADTPPLHLKRESTRNAIITRPEVRGGAETTRGRDAQDTVGMTKEGTSVGHIDITGMTRRIRVLVRHLRLKLRKRKGRRGCLGPGVGPRKMTKNENIKKKE